MQVAIHSDFHHLFLPSHETVDFLNASANNDVILKSTTFLKNQQLLHSSLNATVL